MMGTCPCCQTQVAPEALTCPECGYTDTHGNRAIATLEAQEATIDRYRTVNAGTFLDPTRYSSDFRTLFLDATNLIRTVPDIVQWIRASIGEQQLVADIPRKLQGLIDDGTLAFQLDSDGAILATLINQHKKFSHKIRLKELTLTPDLASARSNLAIQFAFNQVLIKLEDLRTAIADITEGLQDDRLALVESAWDQFEQARSIRSARLREARLVEAQSQAIDGRAQLTATIRRDQAFLIRKKQLNAVQTAKEAINPSSTRTNATTAERFFIALQQVTRATQIEAAVYFLLGEPDAAHTALRQFVSTIEDLGLDNRDTILSLNSFADRDMSGVADRLLEAHTDAIAVLESQNESAQITCASLSQDHVVPTPPSEGIECNHIAAVDHGNTGDLTYDQDEHDV